MRTLQSRYANIKCNMSETGLDPLVVVDFILNPTEEQIDKFGWRGCPESSIAWAVHNEEGKKLHFHMVVRFPSQMRWSALGAFLDSVDPHNYSQPARAYQRSIRYLLHLDNPEKTPIPRQNLQTRNIDDSELSMLLGAPRSCILADIRSIPKMETFRAFDWLCNEKGHSPNEVSQVLRALSQIHDWVRRVEEDEKLKSEIDSVPEFFSSFESIDDDDPFPDGPPAF